jgi:glycosyltransferase involved in cell wall biosynthesis
MNFMPAPAREQELARVQDEFRRTRLDDGRFQLSVLMSTYRGETGANLQASLESIVTQTESVDQIVLVIDGPVGEDQQRVISGFTERATGPRLTLVHLPENRGLAQALNAGLGACSGDYIMRMDSDDLCQPDRVELQCAYARAHPEIDVVCSWSEEFFEDGAPPQLKVSPVDHASVARAMKWRNVLVHPTVLIKAEILRAVGGYRSKFGMLEDYDLFVRLIQRGALFHVIPKVLVRVRSSTAQRGRRGGFRYCLKEIGFRAECWRMGFLDVGTFFAVTSMYVVFRLFGAAVRRRLYALART